MRKILTYFNFSLSVFSDTAFDDSIARKTRVKRITFTCNGKKHHLSNYHISTSRSIKIFLFICTIYGKHEGNIIRTKRVYKPPFL